MKKRFLKKFNLKNDYLSQKDEIMGKPHVVLITDPKTVIYCKRETEPSIDYSKEFFTIEALEDGLTVQLSKNASHYRINNGNWISLGANTATPSINSGQKISFKITNPTIASSYGIGTFTVNKAFNVEGNIMSLLYGDDFEEQINLSGKDNAFSSLFYNCTKLKNAENLILPATTLAYNCYENMFNGCTSLTTAPELPATTLADSCYGYMFRGCTSLTEAPQLPATTLAENCYNSIFFNCTSLTEAPQLPATTLANYCYRYMFKGCTSLTTAPELPATTLADWCYGYIFEGCTSLTTAPELLATTLAFGCYSNMFYGCTSLTTAPELPATILADYCYSFMFYGTNVLPDCNNIDFASESVVASCGLQGLFAGTKVTDADLERILPKNNEGKYCLPATTLATSCYGGMFSNCTSLTTAPELPATTLAKGCYSNMFNGCTSLTTAPELPATTLTYECYYYMFKGCSKLNYIKMLARNISARSCLDNWVSGVASSGTFVKNAAMTSLSSGDNGIPNGWTVEEYGEKNDYSKEFFTIEALGEGTVGIGIPSDATSLKYRKNNEPWIETSEAIQLSVVANDSIQISCVSDSFNGDVCSSLFAISAPFNVKGNIMSLLYGDNFEGQIDLSGKNKAFNSLFSNCTTLQNAANLILPATTLANYCYYYMFNGCTSLTTAPELHATTLADYCYSYMFNICTSLTKAPQLLATTLQSECYSSMFRNCASLTVAPQLPATTLASNCYVDMFSYCTSLTTAPELPATTLESNCYTSMFGGCTNLTTAPELPATKLASYCYTSMFSGCTNLTTAPELPATKLASYCYDNMFNGCSKLTYIKMLATDISASKCLTNWVKGVASSGTFIKNTNMTSLPTGASGIPRGWTVENHITPFIINNTNENITFYYSDGLFTPSSTVTEPLTNYYSQTQLLSFKPNCDIIVDFTNRTNYMWVNNKTLQDVINELTITNISQLGITITQVIIKENDSYSYYGYGATYEWNGETVIDLGLPSGTLWATCNVGASTPWEDGNYYAYGETKPKTVYDSSTYTYSGNTDTLPLENDAAYVNMGSGYHTPTREQCQELVDNTISNWVNINGRSGNWFKSKINGNSIFIPASGYYANYDLFGINESMDVLVSTSYKKNNDRYIYEFYGQNGNIYLNTATTAGYKGKIVRAVFN